MALIFMTSDNVASSELLDAQLAGSEDYRRKRCSVHGGMVRKLWVSVI